ncbi:MAG: site-2 protease family protein [Candidatus Binataceae bacterium]
MQAQNSGIELLKVGGVQVAIDYSWLVIFFLVLWGLSAGYFPQEYPGQPVAAYWVTGLVATFLFFASVLIHELSHAWVANHLGEKVSRITLFIFGGMAHLAGEPENPAVEFQVAGIGPLTSLALGALFWVVYRAMPVATPWTLWRAAFRYLSYINVALALFNLLPGFPLDGGRLMRALVWWRTGDLTRATAAAADWGQGIAFGLIALGAVEIFAGSLIGGLWLIFIGLFLRSAALGSYHHVIVDQMLSRLRVTDIMVRQPVTIHPEVSVADAIDQYFLHLGFGGFPVVKDGQVLGLISLAEVRDCRASERSNRRVGDVMRRLDERVELPLSATVAQALARMTEAETGRMLVMDANRLAGLITRSGIARYLQMQLALSGAVAAPGEGSS